MSNNVFDAAGRDQHNDQQTITTYEIMDGAPVRGETVPIRLFLSGFDLTPTFRDVNKKFSVRYYLNLVLVDEERRRYYKQQEITLLRKPETKPQSSWLSSQPPKTSPSMATADANSNVNQRGIVIVADGADTILRPHSSAPASASGLMPDVLEKAKDRVHNSPESQPSLYHDLPQNEDTPMLSNGDRSYPPPPPRRAFPLGQ